MNKNEKTMFNILHRELKIEHLEPIVQRGWNHDAKIWAERFEDTKGFIRSRERGKKCGLRLRQTLDCF